jgi:hypothetical protein
MSRSQRGGYPRSLILVYKVQSIVFLRSVRRLLVTADVIPSSPILVTLMMEEPSSFETSVLIIIITSVYHYAYV